MLDIKNMNDNTLSMRWKKRYGQVPLDVQKQLDDLSAQNPFDYQLEVIKRQRKIPQKGDVFLVSPKTGIYFYGIVVSDNVNNMAGNGLYVVMIFKSKTAKMDINNFEEDYDKLLIEPSIVGKEYWTRGYFYNVANKDVDSSSLNYGFYSVGKGKYYNEYGEEIIVLPKSLGTFGVATITGIAYEINKELIIDRSLLMWSSIIKVET